MESKSLVIEIAMTESKNGASAGDVHSPNNGRVQDGEKQFSPMRMEVVGLTVLITIVWGLLTLPTVFYHIPVTVSR